MADTPESAKEKLIREGLQEQQIPDHGTVLIFRYIVKNLAKSWPAGHFGKYVLAVEAMGQPASSVMERTRSELCKPEIYCELMGDDGAEVWENLHPADILLPLYTR